MSGSTESGQKARDTNKLKYGDDYYSKLGELGGKAKNKRKGFGSMTPEQRKELASQGGRKRWVTK